MRCRSLSSISSDASRMRSICSPTELSAYGTMGVAASTSSSPVSAEAAMGASAKPAR